MPRAIRRYLGDLLLNRWGLRDGLLRVLLPDGFHLTKFIAARLEERGARARDVLASAVFTLDDEKGAPSERLLELAVKAIDGTRRISIEELLTQRPKAGVNEIAYANVWPGQHYRLLAGIVDAIKPKLVVEIGTAEGLSALCLKRHLPPGGKVLTFDIVEWSKYPVTCLRPADFEGGGLEQIVADLSAPEVFHRYRDQLAAAELFFIDAPKDGYFEPRFLELLAGVKFPHTAWVLLDDIRTWNMLDVWRRIDRPKLDLTSFGHWSGTGLVEWR